MIVYFNRDFIYYVEFKRIKFLISNDGGKNFNKDLKSLLSDKKNIEFIYAEPGIENNRQNILNHTNSKYIYIIDYDDELKLDESKLLDILDHTKDEIIMVNPYENESIPDYIYHSDTQLFVTTWAQIFSTDFIRQVGGYIQTWNFYHEEFGTNANILANIYSRNIQYDVSYIQDDKILYYNHLLNDDAHNSLLKMDISKIISFIKEVPKNDRIFLVIILKEQRYILSNQNSFELKDIFECGQCFRWNEQDDGSYTGVIQNAIINVKKEKENIFIK